MDTRLGKEEQNPPTHEHPFSVINRNSVTQHVSGLPCFVSGGGSHIQKTLLVFCFKGVFLETVKGEKIEIIFYLRSLVLPGERKLPPWFW